MGVSGPSLLIESTDSMIYYIYHCKNKMVTLTHFRLPQLHRILSQDSCGYLAVLTSKAIIVVPPSHIFSTNAYYYAT